MLQRTALPRESAFQSAARFAHRASLRRKPSWCRQHPGRSPIADSVESLPRRRSQADNLPSSLSFPDRDGSITRFGRAKRLLKLRNGVYQSSAKSEARNEARSESKTGRTHLFPGQESQRDGGPSEEISANPCSKKGGAPCFYSYLTYFKSLIVDFRCV